MVRAQIQLIHRHASSYTIIHHHTSYIMYVYHRIIIYHTIYDYIHKDTPRTQALIESLASSSLTRNCAEKASWPRSSNRSLSSRAWPHVRRHQKCHYLFQLLKLWKQKISKVFVIHWVVPLPSNSHFTKNFRYLKWRY